MEFLPQFITSYIHKDILNLGDHGSNDNEEKT